MTDKVPAPPAVKEKERADKEIVSQESVYPFHLHKPTDQTDIRLRNQRVDMIEVKQNYRLLLIRIDQLEQQVTILQRGFDLQSREMKLLLDMFGDRLKKKR